MAFQIAIGLGEVKMMIWVCLVLKFLIRIFFKVKRILSNNFTIGRPNSDYVRFSMLKHVKRKRVQPKLVFVLFFKFNPPKLSLVDKGVARDGLRGLKPALPRHVGKGKIIGRKMMKKVKFFMLTTC